MGAIVVSAPVAKSLKPGDHGTTFGGSPLATRIGLELFSRISNPEFLKHVLDMGLVFEERSKGLPHVIQSRGKGLLRGIQLAPTIDLSNFTSKCLSEGLLVVSAGSQTIRLIPPLVITEDQVNQGMDIIEKVLASY